MNKRIKEFARQAGFKVNFQNEDHQAIRMAQYQEFADLIVRECIRYCDDNLSKTVGGALKIHLGVQDLTTEELSKDADEWYEKLLWEEKE